MNNNKNVACLFMLLVILSSCIAAEKSSQKLILEDFEANLKQLQVCPFEEKMPVSRTYYLKQAALTCTYPSDSLGKNGENYSQTSDSWAAILQLWLIGENDFVELLWWKKDDALTRAFIVALEWCEISIPSQTDENWPEGINNFEASAKRFESIEQGMRAHEIDFVRKNRQILAKEIYIILSKSHIKNAEQYKVIAEQSSSPKQNEPK